MTRIVAVSAYPPQEIEEHTKKVGMDDALLKPVDPDMVAGVIKKHYYRERGTSYRTDS